MKKTALSILVLSTLMAALPVRAEFAHYALLIVSGYSGPALANFPVLVRLSPERIVGFAYDDVASGLGADIAFTSVDGTSVYPHEVDTWNPDGESLVWVRLPSLEPNIRFSVHWGDVARQVAFGAASTGQDYAFGGRYDEIRMLGAAASADWIAAETDGWHGLVG